MTIQVSQKHTINVPVLSSLIQMFGLGILEPKPKIDFFTFVINGLKNCKQAIWYFEKFPLRTKKQNSFIVFKELMQSIENKEHLD